MPTAVGNRNAKSRQLPIRDRKRLRQIAHHLHPVVTIGDQGVTEALIAETERALTDHELIKVKVNDGDRETRGAAGDSLAGACHAEIVQRIGKILVLFRPNPDAKPRLSNLKRFST